MMAVRQSGAEPIPEAMIGKIVYIDMIIYMIICNYDYIYVCVCVCVRCVCVQVPYDIQLF